MEDTDWGAGEGSGGNVSHGEQAMGSSKQSFSCLPTIVLLPVCSLAPNWGALL